MAVRDRFTEYELSAIRQATAAAEAETGGELVCVIVERCDTYEASIWKAAAFGAIGGALAAGLWQISMDAWGSALLGWILLPPVLGAAAGVLMISLLPSLQRIMIPSSVLETRVDRRATEAFVQEEVFATRERTGVLLFVALFEHRIRILRDRGVEDRVPGAAWAEVVRNLSEGLQSGRRGAAVAEAVAACGRVLVDHGVARRADDEDELDNQPRLYDE